MVLKQCNPVPFSITQSFAYDHCLNHTACMSQAAASASASLLTQAVEVEPEVSSHAIEGTGDLASHAVEDAHEPIPSHAI